MASDADKHLQSHPPQLFHGLRKVPDLAAAEVAVSRLPCARLAAVQRLGEGEVDAACLQGVGGFRQQGRAVTGAVAGGASRPERRLGDRWSRSGMQAQDTVERRTRVPRLKSVPTSMSDVSTSFSPQLRAGAGGRKGDEEQTGVGGAEVLLGSMPARCSAPPGAGRHAGGRDPHLFAGLPTTAPLEAHLELMLGHSVCSWCQRASSLRSEPAGMVGCWWKSNQPLRVRFGSIPQRLACLSNRRWVRCKQR